MWNDGGWLERLRVCWRAQETWAASFPVQFPGIIPVNTNFIFPKNLGQSNVIPAVQGALESRYCLFAGCCDVFNWQQMPWWELWEEPSDHSFPIQNLNYVPTIRDIDQEMHAMSVLILHVFTSSLLLVMIWRWAVVSDGVWEIRSTIFSCLSHACLWCLQM